MAAAVLPALIIGFLSFTGVASGQTKPDGVSAYVDSLGVHVKVAACASDVYGSDQTKTNCYNFGIYRNPPGFDKPSIGTAYLVNNSVIPFTDPGSPNLQVGQAYSYRVCTNISPNNDGSNCLTTNAVTIPAKTIEQPPFVTLTGSAASIPYGSQTSLSWTSANAYKLELSGVGKVTVPSGSIQVNPLATQTYTITATRSDGKQASANFTINVFCPTPTAPGTVDAFGGPAGINLKWTNPNTPAGKSCPVPSNQVLIYRLGPGTNQFQLIATLSKPNNGILPDHYIDNGPFQPHMGYLYEVCEGGPPNWQNPYDCKSPRDPAVSWGANPVLNATRLNRTTIRLRLDLDQNTVSSVVVTRQGSDDPCRQGQKLGNGLQGCPNNPVVLAQNSPVIYSWTASAQSPVAPGFDHPLTPPFVIDIPDDTTVHPAAEYWYQTGVVWLGTLEQDAATVTVPSMYASAGAQRTLIGAAAQPIKLNGSAPPPQSGSSVPATMAHTTTLAPSSATMRPAGTATTVPARRSVTAVRTMMTPMTKPTTPMLQPRQPMMSSTGAPTAPTIAHSATEARPMMTLTGQARSSALLKVGLLPGGASRISRIQQKPHDAQALYALGKAYCGQNLKDICLSYMYMALSSAQSAGNASLVKQIKASLGAQ